jgi:hypothetical protein
MSIVSSLLCTMRRMAPESRLLTEAGLLHLGILGKYASVILKFSDLDSFKS